MKYTGNNIFLSILATAFKHFVSWIKLKDTQFARWTEMKDTAHETP